MKLTLPIWGGFLPIGENRFILGISCSILSEDLICGAVKSIIVANACDWRNPNGQADI